MGLLSNVYKKVDVGGMTDAFGKYNAMVGIPRAVNTALTQNANVANQTTAQTGAINSAAANAVAQQIERLNTNTSNFSTSQSIGLNQQASNFSTRQSLSQNAQVAAQSSAQSNALNAAANRAGTDAARQSAEELNLFTTLNAALLNNRIAVPAANQAASALNESATKDVLKSQAEMFGGEGDFDNFRNQVNKNLDDMLNGRVSQSTRRQLARSAISSGNTELGDQSVDDFYTGYLGLTSEQLRSQGQQQYESLYGLYRQSVPITSGAQLLNNYALSNSQASQQAYGTANQLTGMGGVSAGQLVGLSGISNQQLFGAAGINNRDIYGTNSLSAQQLYGTNALSNETAYRTNALSTSQALPYSTITPGEAIGFEIQNNQNLANSQQARSRLAVDLLRAGGYTGGSGGGVTAGAGPGGGLRTGNLQGGAKF